MLKKVNIQWIITGARNFLELIGEKRFEILMKGTFCRTFVYSYLPQVRLENEST